MEFLDVLDTKSALPSELTCNLSAEFVSDTSSELSETKRGPQVSFTHFTKQPRNLVDRFLEITGCRPCKFLKRFGRTGDAKTFMEKSLMRHAPTDDSRQKAATDSNSKREAKAKAKSSIRRRRSDGEAVRRPLLVEKHSSDEDVEAGEGEEGVGGDAAWARAAVALVTQRRAKYRERVAREKRRVEETKRAFARMAEEEAADKRKSKLRQEAVPSVRPTRGSRLRDILVLGQRGERKPKRRECALRTQEAATARRFDRRSCNPWLDHDAAGPSRTPFPRTAAQDAYAHAQAMKPPPTAFVQRPRGRCKRPGGRGLSWTPKAALALASDDYRETSTARPPFK